jgi:hypothetical protein
MPRAADVTFRERESILNCVRVEFSTIFSSGEPQWTIFEFCTSPGRPRNLCGFSKGEFRPKAVIHRYSPKNKPRLCNNRLQGAYEPFVSI